MRAVGDLGLQPLIHRPPPATHVTRGPQVYLTSPYLAQADPTRLKRAGAG
eukprot:CAMPEP_0185479366 /NCGR_PEP_ID=MMETSP1366-20130426/5426_1 /TAXON_ID=38817 /ORGANISM="Gephyrocapsa oceanica, Strain RCC1303" /LENGTH=49 /DNA_ID= /DNA_START= /DNA_END= /DNA_ORIENTATION=